MEKTKQKEVKINDITFLFDYVNIYFNHKKYIIHKQDLVTLDTNLRTGCFRNIIVNVYDFDFNNGWIKTGKEILLSKIDYAETITCKQIIEMFNTWKEHNNFNFSDIKKTLLENINQNVDNDEGLSEITKINDWLDTMEQTLVKEYLKACNGNDVSCYWVFENVKINGIKANEMVKKGCIVKRDEIAKIKIAVKNDDKNILEFFAKKMDEFLKIKNFNNFTFLRNIEDYLSKPNFNFNRSGYEIGTYAASKFEEVIKYMKPYSDVVFYEINDNLKELNKCDNFDFLILIKNKEVSKTNYAIPTIELDLTEDNLRAGNRDPKTISYFNMIHDRIKDMQAKCKTIIKAKE